MHHPPHRRWLPLVAAVVFSLVTIQRLQAQTPVDRLFTRITQLDPARGAQAIADFERDELPRCNDSLRCDFLYVKGIYYERIKQLDTAVTFYRASALMADSMRYYDPSFFDCVFRTIHIDYDHERYAEAIHLGQAAIHAPQEKQQAYPLTYRIYMDLAANMNAAYKYAEVPEVARLGMPYVRQKLAPTDWTYSTLPYSEAIAWLLMGDTERADSIGQWISSLPCAQTPEVAHGLSLLRNDIARYRERPWAQRKQEMLDKLEQGMSRLKLVDADTPQGEKAYHEWLDLTRSTLALVYFDIDNPNDERLWNHWLTSLVSFTFFDCYNLPGLSGEIYNNAILQKDFLALHTSKLKKSLTTWQDIQQRLHADEAAIEFNFLPPKVLLLRKDLEVPIDIPIDTTVLYAIDEHLGDEPLTISRLYAPDGPLAQLWQIIEPHLHGIHTLYFSASNEFSQINYGAIPLGDGVVADRYRFHSLLSSSDAARPRPARRPMQSASIIACTSLPEAEAVDSLMTAAGFSHHLLKDADANSQAVENLSGRAPEIIHLSAHGFMEAPVYGQDGETDTAQWSTPSVLSQSGLRMADGRLTSRELMKLDLSYCQLAVLSACRSALGGNKSFAGLPFGVAYALKLAGVDQVLCCLWSVSEQATAVFMRHFYTQLLNNIKSPTLPQADWAIQALRQAQLDMQADGYTNPYYWAPFVIVE